MVILNYNKLPKFYKVKLKQTLQGGETCNQDRFYSKSKTF